MRIHIFHITLFTIFSSVVFLTSCGTTNQTRAKNEYTSLDAKEIEPKNYENTSGSWENMFSRVSGLQVAGTYPNLSLKVRGASSFQLTTEPLFVLDGVALGHDFRGLADAVNITDVKSIRVLKGPEASFYGSRGANGVIVVKSKK